MRDVTDRRGFGVTSFFSSTFLARGDLTPGDTGVGLGGTDRLSVGAGLTCLRAFTGRVFADAAVTPLCSTCCEATDDVPNDVVEVILLDRADEDTGELPEEVGERNGILARFGDGLVGGLGLVTTGGVILGFVRGETSWVWGVFFFLSVFGDGSVRMVRTSGETGARVLDGVG